MSDAVFWSAYCEDVDCVDCARDKVITVETPDDWEEEKVVRYLQAQGYTCLEGNWIFLAYEFYDRPEFFEKARTHVKVKSTWL